MSEKYCFTHDSTPLEEIYPENRKVADADLGCPKCSRLYTWCEVNEILWMYTPSAATAKADVVCPNCGFCILSEIDGIKRGCPICKKWYVRSSNWITPFIGYNYTIPMVLPEGDSLLDIMKNTPIIDRDILDNLPEVISLEEVENFKDRGDIEGDNRWK